MQFILSTGSLYNYSVARCFDFAAQAGFDGIEVMIDPRFDTRQPGHLQRLTGLYGLPVVALHSPFPLQLLGDWPRDEPGRIRRTLALAETLGAKVVTHHLPYRVGIGVLQLAGKRTFFPVPGWNQHRDYIRWLQEDYAAFKAATNVNVCIENLPAKRFLGRDRNAFVWNTPQEIARFPNLTLDTTHLATWGLDPLDVYPRWGKKVGHVHLSNYKDGQEHRRPEAGDLRLDKLLALLAADGYTGAISMELRPDALEAGSPDTRIVELLANSLAYCRAAASAPITPAEVTTTATL